MLKIIVALVFFAAIGLQSVVGVAGTERFEDFLILEAEMDMIAEKRGEDGIILLDNEQMQEYRHLLDKRILQEGQLASENTGEDSLMIYDEQSREWKQVHLAGVAADGAHTTAAIQAILFASSAGVANVWLSSFSSVPQLFAVGGVTALVVGGVVYYVSYAYHLDKLKKQHGE